MPIAIEMLNFFGAFFTKLKLLAAVAGIGFSILFLFN
jgi:hypothetical protein